MALEKIFTVVQVTVGVFLVGAILLQARGAGLGETFGGSGGFYGNRRGPERGLYLITIGLATLFVLLSFVILLL